MTLHVITTEEKIGVVDRLILSEKRHGNPAIAEVLKSIAADLRARIDCAPSVALIDIDRRVVAVKRSQTNGGYDPHALHELGQGVAQHWPAIKQALELYGADAEAVAVS